VERYVEALNLHYGRHSLGDAILAGLRAAGKDLTRLVPDDLAPVDQFHSRGKEATLELARIAGLEGRMHVLDVGGGVGGPARMLAAELGCRVTVLDLVHEFCRVGEELTARTGLSDRVGFRHGNALDMPFADGTFDVAWTQHSSMNIDDKAGLYREIRRVVQPGGRLALHEIVGGSKAPIHFPVPWARAPSMSFLRPAHEVHALIAATGFAEIAWVDGSAQTLEWFRRQAARAPATPPPLGLHLLLGSDFSQMLRNQVRNLEEGRMVLIQAVLEKTH